MPAPAHPVLAAYRTSCTQSPGARGGYGWYRAIGAILLIRCDLTGDWHAVHEELRGNQLVRSATSDCRVGTVWKTLFIDNGTRNPDEKSIGLEADSQA